MIILGIHAFSFVSVPVPIITSIGGSVITVPVELVSIRGSGLVPDFRKIATTIFFDASIFTVQVSDIRGSLVLSLLVALRQSYCHPANIYPFAGDAVN